MSTDRQPPRIIFFGTPEFAVPALRMLHAHAFDIAAVVTAPDKPIGRKAILTPTPVKAAAQEFDLTVFTPEKLSEIKEQLAARAPDVGIVVAYGKIIPQSVLDLFPKGVLNIHPSDLPEYRGPSPIQSAILDGKSATKISLMLLDAEMDHGPIIAKEEWIIPPDADYLFCEYELAHRGAELLVKTLPGYVDGTLAPQSQDHDHATYTHKFKREDGRLEWILPAEQIHNRIRALAANPGTWTAWAGKTINVFKAHVTDAPASPPGTVLRHDGELTIACGSRALVIEEVQIEGGKRQSGKDFLNGHQGVIGAIFG